MNENKVKFALYLPPEKKAELERCYREEGCRSITAFIEKAIDFYLGYLDANSAGAFLPKETFEQKARDYGDDNEGNEPWQDCLSRVPTSRAVEAVGLAAMPSTSAPVTVWNCFPPAT